MALPVTVPLLPEETMLSFASRLAAANGVSRLSNLCGHLGLDLNALVRGNEGQIERLAGFGGVEARDLMNRTSRLSDDGLVWFRSERLALSAIHRRRVRACPECVSQDRARGDGLASRPLWALSRPGAVATTACIWSTPRRSFPTIFRQPGTSMTCRAQPAAASHFSRFGRETASKTDRRCVDRQA